jgi:threonylcarbamoyladenosine tRNA methylthiotransferase MtaB
MNRNYSRSYVRSLVAELHEKIPALTLGADLIVGFPGETDENFRNTYDLIGSLPLAYLHVFPFSRRKGTPAAQFSQRVDEGKIKDRSRRLRDLGKEKRQTFYRRFLGQELKVLVEGRQKIGSGWRGFSRNYIPVVFIDGDNAEKRNRVNEEVTVIVTEATDRGMSGHEAR